MKHWAVGNYPSRSQIDAAVDALAEELSRDRDTLAQIAERLGRTFGTACVILRELCSRYGEEARA